MDKQLTVKYLMFENDTNICWLDASIALVAHNKTFRKIVEYSPESQINKIISTYNVAIATFNSSIHEQKLKSPQILKAIQVSTLKYLKQFLKFKTGEPDSTFCALLNLIYQDKSNIKESLNVNWIWRKQCSNCAMNSDCAISKPIITLCEVNTFHPASPSCIYTCICKSKQEMTLIYKKLPPCLIFHFEKGIGTSTNFPLFFFIKGREYQLTGIVILQKGSPDLNVNHFVTWIRNPRSKKWLECNDIIPGFASFTPLEPVCHLGDIYISVFEAFDDLGRINNEVGIDHEQVVENINVELIDLSDEENASNTGSHFKTSTWDSSKSSSDDEISNFLNNSFSEIGASKKELFTTYKKDVALEDLKMYADGMSEESETSSHIKNQKVYLFDLKLPIKVSHPGPEIETISKIFYHQDNFVDEFIEANKSINEATNDPEHEVSESSVAGKKETLSSPSIDNKNSTIENLEMHNSENPKESKEDWKSNKKRSVGNFNLSKELNEFIEANKSINEATNDPEHEVSESSVAGKKETLSSPSINNENSTIENLEMHNRENPKKSKEDWKSNKKRSVGNFNLSKELSLNKRKTEMKSVTAVKKSFETKKVKATENPEDKVAEPLDGNKKENCSISTNKNISAIKNLQLCSNEKITEKHISSQSIFITTNRFSNKRYPNKQELETKFENLNYDGKQVNEIAKVEKSLAGAIKYPNLSISDAPVWNKKDKILNLLDSDSAVENLAADDTTHEESSLTMCGFIGNTSNVSKNEVDKYKKEKSKIKVEQIPFEENVTSDNENKCISTNQKKRERTDDEQASSSKRKKERSSDKYVNRNKEKCVAIINDQTASSSLADDELSKNYLCRSKRSSKSDSHCVSKKTKLSNSNKIHNCNSSSNKISREKLKNIVDSVVKRTVAAFFEKIVQIHDAKQQVPDSAP